MEENDFTELLIFKTIAKGGRNDQPHHLHLVLVLMDALEMLISANGCLYHVLFSKDKGSDRAAL